MTEQNTSDNSRREITKVEGNFIELFPVRFAQFKRRAAARTETITKPRGTAVIRHNSRYFTAFDMDVMLAAFALACRHNQRCFPATLSDFARIMKITGCGKNLNAVRESLAELSATTATFNNIWYDCADRTYKSETVLAFIAYRLTRREEAIRGKLRSDEIRQLSWIEIPKHFYDSIENGYFRYIDAEVYFSLPSGLSRAAFLYFEKRLGVKEHYEEKIDSALANIIKRPPTPKDIKNFKYRTIAKLSGVFRFDKKKLDNGILSIARRQLLRGAATGTTTTASISEVAAVASSAAMATVAATASAETTEVAGAVEVSEKASAVATVGDFTPHPAAPPPIRNVACPARPPLHKNSAAHSDTTQFSQPRPEAPRRKFTSHDEYILERACILCNRDDDYFKNVVRKYIFLRGADMVGGAIGDTRDARPESTSRYLIHLLKNL